MTRISKRILTFILSAMAFFALVFGIVFTAPRVKTAKAADTAVTFSAAALGDASDATYGTAIRFDTSGLQWQTYHNWVAASDWASIADYTTVNGRTVTEINNATTHTQKITLMMQPAGSFSFLRLYIPAEIIPLGEVKAMGILDGWSFDNGTNNYTTSEVTFLRNGDTMVLADSYSAVTKLAASDITIGDAQLVNPSNAAWGADSFYVDINIGMQGYSDDVYQPMRSSYNVVRRAIYINGKSIDEWNSQLIAGDARFNEPSTYSMFPQRSTDAGHKDIFVKPIFLLGTSTGFRLFLFQEVFADCTEITIAVGQGCTLAGSFMVAENISKTVWTQQVINITDQFSFLDNTHNANWNNTTNLYYMYTNQKYWTKHPLGNCFNEYDIEGKGSAGGGQIQMKYVYFNGTSLYELNKGDNNIYESKHENIINSGCYAPIFCHVSQELGSCLKLAVPSNFTNGKGGHEEIVIKKGFNIYENGTSYYVKNDVVFTNDGAGNWTTEVKGKEIATEVTGIITKANRTDGKDNENFVIFQLSNNDYAGCNTTAITDISSLYGYIDIGGTVVESYSGEKFFNVWNIANSVAFRFADYTTLQNVPYITIKAGAKFPSYNTQNGGSLTYFVTSEDVTFIHDVPNDTWTVGSISNLEYTVTFKVDDTTYQTQTVKGGDTVTKPTNPTKADDAQYTYTFDCWLLDEAEYNFSTPVLKDITLVAQFNSNMKPSTVDISSGLNFSDQGTNIDGTTGNETYLITTSQLAWTNTGTGRINKDYPDALNYIYFNGQSIAEINAESDDAYGSAFETITGNADCAPIAVLYNKLSETSSHLQIWVPTGYPTLGGTAEQNHQSIEIKKGFTITQGLTTWTVQEDVKWININGSWVNANTTFEASEVTIDNPRVDGVAKELYKVDITFPVDYKFDCNNYDFMYDSGNYPNYRKQIFINGESIYDINANTDDSGYVYSTAPMMNSGETFAKPIIIETYTGQYNSSQPANDAAPTNLMTIWIHERYVVTLGEEFVITIGAGFKYNGVTNSGQYTWSKVLGENVSYDMIAEVTVNDGSKTTTSKIVKGTTIQSLYGTPSKEMTSTQIYTFDNWYIADTDTVYDAAMPITGDISVEARFTETTVTLLETEVVGITHYLKTSTDNWLAFELSKHDYGDAEENQDIGGYSELLRIGFLDKVILKGNIVLNNGATVTEATLMDVYNSYGPQEGPLMNFWHLEQFALRLPVGDGVDEIVIQEGCFFPSYKYISGQATDTRFAVMKEATYKYDESVGAFVKQAAIAIDIHMEAGAAVRVHNSADETERYDNSGIRFQTNISKASIEALHTAVNAGKYTSVTFGTLIVPTDYLMGGTFNHAWLTSNHGAPNVVGGGFLDIVSTVTFGTSIDEDVWAGETEDCFYFYGSIVKLIDTNYGRYFSAIGYVKLVNTNGEEIYIYANYEAKNSRSASFVADAAINDRSETKTDEYPNLTINNNYSPYTDSERTFLDGYIVWSDSAVTAENFSLSNNNGLHSGKKTVEIESTKQKLAGPYVKLVYSTDINVWGVFTYTDGSKTVSEDFYLQAGTTEHKQYLDIFRYNGVGYGMNTSNLFLQSITFTNAELENTAACNFKLLGLYSEFKTIDTAKQEIYLTVKQNNGSEMTVGAHLGIGGGLTYLAKSGIYEGVIGGSSGWKNGTVAISTNKNVFDATNKYKSGSSSSSYSEEKGYYGHATSSKPADGAVNLINNFDAGRQIQQSWYAQVGGSDDATDGSNGYDRAYCYTGSTEGQYWPYNPVQAGDVVSNPGQIIDYEINEAKGYIYVKARAMDWAKGYDSSNPCENAVVGGVTTKSYMENYYRLKADGTVIVNNSFVDWNGFTNMESCDWASTELPAVYPVHTLNYYVSNTNGDGSWTDALEYKNDLKAWTGGNAYHQFSNASQGDTKVEDWFAWANGGDGNAFGMGMYIPNVNRYTSGRAFTSTAYYTDVNFQNSNALPVPNYTKYIAFQGNVSQVSALAQRGNILADKGMLSNMQPIKYTYQSAYVSNTSYTAPGIDFRMEAYKPIEYSYVLCVDTVTNIRSTFKAIKDKGTVTNAGNGYEKVGLDAWARADKKWTW